ncbi:MULTISPECIES: ATP-binding protein [unclassified Limnothrix]|uniref:ATP-binding protein n=1 Tax=unclassified Limnothrix TaxID=2632864 RepID=UPI001F5537C7|nr:MULTISPECIES: ATP-binding protein [unclassified Limnothrix]
MTTPYMPRKKVVQKRREYNAWVATETIEDYSLRYAPQSFRKWSEFLVANTALGGISFLALEAIGGSLVISYGFSNSFWAILVVGLLIGLAGIPISYYAAKYNVDIDLLTRGAGFGYIGSTITSLIYASFTFIFFALEAAILAQALELYWHLPLWLGYILCSLVVLPIVFYGITAIERLQFWTQPIWLILMGLPFVFVGLKEPAALDRWLHFAGNSPSGAAFDPLLFGAAATVSFSLIAQLGEQVDYLRFLPECGPNNRIRWWLAVLAAGPGWIVLGAAKQLGGAFLATLAIEHGASFAKAKEPIQMYLAGFATVFDDPQVVLTVGVFFVIISQIKINVTNAYAGSLAWSNFFSRLTHSHPGRVVWLVFNVSIALLLMELGVFETLEAVLGLYSNVAIAWIGAIVADLVINKPLKLSPSYVEFKRAYLYNFNPVGFGSMVVASVIAMVAFVGLFGETLRAYAPFLALGIAFGLSPLIAWATQGRYYIARPNEVRLNFPAATLVSCCVCDNEYEPSDLAFCPVYDGHICSLCCSLDAHCHDSCKPSVGEQVRLAAIVAQAIFGDRLSLRLGKRMVRFLGLFAAMAALLGAIFALVYTLGPIAELPLAQPDAESMPLLETFGVLYAMLLVLSGIAVWWWVLTDESRELAEEELDNQNLQLQQEVRDREAAEAALQDLAKDLEQRVKQRTAQLSEALTVLKKAQTQLVQTEKMSSLGQMVAGVAHEINNPVNFIHGNLEHACNYVQDVLALLVAYQLAFPKATPEILELADEIDVTFVQEDLPKLLKSMRVGTDRIREIVLSLRTFSRLDEAEVKSVDIHAGLDSTLMILSNRLKATDQRPAIQIQKHYGELSPIECYAGQMNQVFMNLLTNAIDAIDEDKRGDREPPQIAITTTLADPETVQIVITDNGPGIAPEVQRNLFDAFFTTKDVGKGTGLGLSIAQQIVVERHGGRLTCRSELNHSTSFLIEIPMRQFVED